MRFRALLGAALLAAASGLQLPACQLAHLHAAPGRAPAPRAQQKPDSSTPKWPSFGFPMAREEPLADSPADSAEGEEVGIKEMLTKYGLFALAFHFSVWATSLTLVYSALSAGGLDMTQLPAPLENLLAANPDAPPVAAGAGAAARFSAALGIVELFGPLRLALTVAATPRLSVVARRYAAVRAAEEWALRKWDEVAGPSS